MERTGCLALVALAACGCTRVGYLEQPDGWCSGRYAHLEQTQVVTVNAAPLPASPPPPVARRAPADVGPPPFDAAAAKSALRTADLSDCRPEHALARYGHAQITFAPTGAVKRVVIDSPPGLTDEAVQCAGKGLASVSVPAFAGNELTMGTGWTW